MIKNSKRGLRIVGFVVGAIVISVAGMIAPLGLMLDNADAGAMRFLSFMQAHNPPPFSFWYFESLPEKARNNSAKEYLDKQFPVGSNIIEAIHELEKAGAKCTEWKGNNSQSSNGYSCLHNMREPFGSTRKWHIAFFDRDKNNTISKIYVQERDARTIAEESEFISLINEN
jgi:hypothetical protein